jgi:hypothetical protein
MYVCMCVTGYQGKRDKKKSHQKSSIPRRAMPLPIPVPTARAASQPNPDPIRKPKTPSPSSEERHAMQRESRTNKKKKTNTPMQESYTAANRLADYGRRPSPGVGDYPLRAWSRCSRRPSSPSPVMWRTF